MSKKENAFKEYHKYSIPLGEEEPLADFADLFTSPRAANMVGTPTLLFGDSGTSGSKITQHDYKSCGTLTTIIIIILQPTFNVRFKWIEFLLLIIILKVLDFWLIEIRCSLATRH